MGFHLKTYFATASLVSSLISLLAFLDTDQATAHAIVLPDDSSKNLVATRVKRDDSAWAKAHLLDNSWITGVRIRNKRSLENAENSKSFVPSVVENEESGISSKFKRSPHHSRRRKYYNRVSDSELQSDEVLHHRHGNHPLRPHGRKGDVFNFNIDTGSSGSGKKSKKKSKKPNKDSKTGSKSPAEATEVEDEPENEEDTGNPTDSPPQPQSAGGAFVHDGFWMPPVEGVPLGVAEVGW